MTYKVALCGLNDRDRQLAEIVIARAPNPKYPYLVGQAPAMLTADIAVADAASEQALAAVVELRKTSPNLAVIYISYNGFSGDSPYKIESRSLLLRINRILDDVVEAELQKNTDVTPPTPAKVVSIVSQLPQESVFIDSPFAEKSTVVVPLRALIVDDSLAVREQLRSALERAGIESDQAENAESALAHVGSCNYDIIFLDVVMPGADGYEVCRSIKKNASTRKMPVLMLTSRSSPFDRARGALAGCDSYLVKPITWETFFNAVDKVLTKQFRNDRELLNARGYRSALAR